MNEVCIKNILDFYENLTAIGYELNIDITETSIYVLGDQEALERIMNNLIFNSIRYGSDGRFIGLNLSCHDKLGGEIFLNSKPYEKTSFTFKLKRINY